MNPYAEALGAWFGRAFDSKTIVALALIGSATWLCDSGRLSAEAWAVMVTTIGGLWGLSAAATSTTVREIAQKAIQQ